MSHLTDAPIVIIGISGYCGKVFISNIDIMKWTVKSLRDGLSVFATARG